MNVDPVEVVPYDDRWPRLFEEERERILDAIGPWVLGLEHIGSTAVPGLAAKSVVDVMVGVQSLDDSPVIIEHLGGIGYEYLPGLEGAMPFRRYFRKFQNGRRTHQIHLVERSNAEWWNDHLDFRDYLRSHPEAAREYADLKLGLAARFRNDREAYTDAKTEFVAGVLRCARRG